MDRSYSVLLPCFERKADEEEMEVSLYSSIRHMIIIRRLSIQFKKRKEDVLDQIK